MTGFLKCFPKRGLSGGLPRSVLTSLIAMALTVNGLGCLPVHAATQTLPLTRLGLENTIYLPGVRPQRVIEFTRPRTWSVQGATLETTFQHSAQLREGSRLQIIFNDKILKTVSLTAANAKATPLAIAIAGNLMQDRNRLIFRVEQHYTDTCEDPLNPSLWTNILASASRLNFNYTPKAAALSLNQFPYPLVDALNQQETTLQFVIPKSADPAIVQAMARLSSVLAQASPKQEIRANVQFGEEPLANGPNPLIILATPGSLRGLPAQLAAKVAVAGAQPVIQLVSKANGAPALVVLGATPAAVAQGVDELLNRSVGGALPATGRLVVSGKTELPPTGKPAPYVVDQPVTLATLGYDVQTVKMLTAPPITFRLPVMTEFVHRPESRLALELHYGFSPHLNPRFSGVEFRLNDYAIATIPLTNIKGNDNAKATITLPAELIQADNRLVAQFHLMPDKHGLCSEPYRDTAWGKMYPDSKIIVTGKADTRLPNLALLKEGYPYTQQLQLAQTHIQLEKPDRASLNLLLAVANRLGRQVNPSLARPLGSLLEVGLGTGTLPSDKHVILIGTGTAVQFNRTFKPSGATLTVQQSQGRSAPTTLLMANESASSWLEQQVSGNGHIITRLVGTSPSAMNGLKSLFVSDALLSRLPDSAAVRLSQGAGGNVGDLQAIEPLAFRPVEDRSAKGRGGVPLWAWITLGTLLVFGAAVAVMRLVLGKRRP